VSGGLPRVTAAIVVACAAALAGCSVAPPPTAAVVPPPAYTPPPSAGDMCLDELTERGIVYDIVPMRAAFGGCNLVDGVRVSRLLAPFDKPAILSCPMALRVDEFEINVVQMVAQRYFKQRVVRVQQIGSYSCRNIARTHRLSEHASGQAIDIAGFVLADGMVISVKDDWAGRGPRAQFLHEVAHGACSLFAVVLTPATNADHHDHLHLDIGPRPLCDA
jgi:hypothetical protein